MSKFMPFHSGMKTKLEEFTQWITAEYRNKFGLDPTPIPALTGDGTKEVE
jgi:hypothetical protein